MGDIKKFTIKRTSKTGFGVFGVIHDSYDHPFALTAERQDFNNEVGRSCIPDGTYKCKKIISPKFGHCISVMDVPGRKYILIHKGNVPLKDSTGCILVGEQFDYLHNQMAVLSSKHAFDELMKLAADEFELEIRWCL